MSLPLAGVKVLELGRFVAAPWCGQILADLGAEVIKIEKPDGGDQLRYYPPWLKDRKTGGSTSDSSYFLSFNRGKKSVTVDFSRDEGRNIILQLARQCDVVIENFRAGHLAHYGLDKESVKHINPEVIYLSISGFGQTGPYCDRPGLDSVFQSMGGLVSITGEAGGPPTKIGVTIVDLITGFYGAIGCLAALRGREVLQSGGEVIDLALLDSAIAIMTNRAQDYLLTGEVPSATGSRSPGMVASGFYRCVDGWINLQAGDNRGFKKFCNALGHPEWSEEARFRDVAARWEHREELLQLINAEISTWSVVTLVDLLHRHDIICSPIYSLDQTFKDPQVIHRRVETHYDHPAAGRVPTVGCPLKFEHNPISNYIAPPMLGEHTETTLADLGYTTEDIAGLARDNIISLNADNST